MSDADERRTPLHRVALIGLGLLIVAAGVVLYLALRPPPQLGASERVFKTVDALYTAVRDEDAKRVGECEARLRDYRAAGELPGSAADKLDAIIASAKRGSYQSAAKRLYDFMAGQRRDGFEPTPKKSAKRK